MTTKNKRIILALIFISIIGLIGIIVYSFNKRPVYHLESQESIESLESNQTIFDIDIFPLKGEINHHYVGLAEKTKTDGVNLDQIEIIILNNNKFIINESFGSNKTTYIGVYEKEDVKYNLYIKYKASNCTKEEYSGEAIELFVNMDESVYYKEISNSNADKEVIKLIDNEEKTSTILDDYLCLN